MKIIQRVVMACTIVATVVAGLSLRNLGFRQVTETRTFCAYGRVFVEFEDNGRVWGTLMLNFRGNPIPCKDNVESAPISNLI